MNRAFQACISRLGQPAALCGMLLLAANDWVLKRVLPGWFSGKLSDFAWFLFAPWILAACIFILLPRKLRSESLAGGLAFGIALLGFALVKTVPAVNQAVVSLAYQAGMPLKLALDPGDVLAASAGCLLSWAAWKKPRLEIRLPRRASLALLAGSAVLILADMAAPNSGIGRLETGSGFIQAADLFSVYVSSDGGLTWQESELPVGPLFSGVPQDGLLKQVQGADDLRYYPGDSVERSSDGGQTWQTLYRFEPMNEVDQQYYRLRSTSGNAIIGLSPLDALKDAQTGNVIFAMGHEGALVYTADGRWIWASVGPYTFDRGLTGDRLSTLLMFPILIALLLAGLAFGILSLFLRSKWWKWLLLLPAAAVGGLMAFTPPAGFQSGYDLGLYLLGGSAILTGLLLTFALIEASDHFRGALLPMAAWALLAGLIYLVGPVLWVLRILSEYGTAALLGVGLSIIVLILGAIRISRKHIRRQPPEGRASSTISTSSEEPSQ